MTTWAVVAVWAIVGGAVGALLSGPVARRSLVATPPESVGRTFALAVGMPATALLFGLLTWRLGVRVDVLPYSVLAAFSIPLGVVDVLERRLPNRLLLVMTSVLVVVIGIAAVLEADLASAVRATAAAVAVAGFYLVLAVVFPGGVGAGDVKLGGAIGLALGWASWSTVLAGTFLAWLLGVVWLAWKGARRSQPASVPMGPFLILGAMLAVCLLPPH